MKGFEVLDSDLINQTIERDKHTVLVVDDDPATCYATARLLRSAGFKTREAATGMEALTLAPQGISAVVLDVHLPDVDGFEVCRLLRAQASTALLPVMHVSAAYITNEDKVRGLDAGADAYLLRPVEPAVLVATLQALIRARMAEEQLRRSEARFRAIYNDAPSGIALIDEDGRFVDVNPALSRMLGRAQRDLVGRVVSDFAPDGWGSFARDKTVTRGRAAKAWQGEFPLSRADGSTLHLEWTISPHVEQGVQIAIALDASERMQLNQRRQEVLEREHAARRAAERLSRTKDDFVAVLSHELRTPLNAIAGWVHILTMRGGSPEVMKGLGAIDRSVKSQARIISDILDVSRINSGKLHLECDWANPAELVAASVNSLQSQIESRGLVVKQDLQDSGKPAWLDATRFQQIVWNLMTNAIKFSYDGGRIDLALKREGDRLSLRIQDFGQGIAPEFVDQMFARFTQADSPGSRHQGGLGLGLSIVKHVVELHGGTVTAHSDGVGRGTTVLVDLSVGAPSAASRAQSAPAVSAEAPESPDALRELDVLIVEDDADAGEMLSVILADRGARTRFAVDFDSAIAAMEESWPDVVVGDIGLPGRDGYELIRAIRKMPPPTGRGGVAAVALTAFARLEDQEKALAAGFDAHLSKPVQPQALVAAICKVSRAKSLQ
jgi:PAS domain S-box-containing protein